MKSPPVSIILAILSFLAATATCKKVPNSDSFPQDIDSILSAAFQIVDLESACAQRACEVSNLDPSICTPAKVEEYRSECADIMERAGMKKSHQKMTGEMESKVREMMKIMEPNFSADKMAKVMEGGEFDAQDLWENMGKFEL